MVRMREVPFAPLSWSELAPLAPYRRWLERFSAWCGDWPPVRAYPYLLATEVDFAEPERRLKAGLDASDIDDSYLGRCAKGIVPTRAGNLHDFLNALTWARFPKAKMAHCHRQVRYAKERGDHTNRLRTPEQDRLAMIDEGGILRTQDDEEICFGHGLLEDAVLGRFSFGFRLRVRSTRDPDVAEILAHVPTSHWVRERIAARPLSGGDGAPTLCTPGPQHEAPPPRVDVATQPFSDRFFRS